MRLTVLVVGAVTFLHCGGALAAARAPRVTEPGLVGREDIILFSDFESENWWRDWGERGLPRNCDLVGGKEALRAIVQELPPDLARKADSRALDLKRGEDEVKRDIVELIEEGERASEHALWEKIRAEYLRGGLAAVGLEEVMTAAKEGRVETMIVDAAFRPEGRRCRKNHQLSHHDRLLPSHGNTRATSAPARSTTSEI